MVYFYMPANRIIFLLAALCSAIRNVRAFFLLTYVASWTHVWSVLWKKAIESGCIWVRGDFKLSANVWEDLPEQLSGSSPCFHACVVDCACSYLSSISLSVCPCLLLSVRACCPWCETAFVWSSKFNRLITLFPSCENTSKQNRYV